MGDTCDVPSADEIQAETQDIRIALSRTLSGTDDELYLDKLTAQFVETISSPPGSARSARSDTTTGAVQGDSQKSEGSDVDFDWEGYINHDEATRKAVITTLIAYTTIGFMCLTPGFSTHLYTIIERTGLPDVFSSFFRGLIRAFTNDQVRGAILGSFRYAASAGRYSAGAASHGAAAGVMITGGIINEFIAALCALGGNVFAQGVGIGVAIGDAVTGSRGLLQIYGALSCMINILVTTGTGCVRDGTAGITRVFSALNDTLSAGIQRLHDLNHLQFAAEGEIEAYTSDIAAKIVTVDQSDRISDIMAKFESYLSISRSQNKEYKKNQELIAELTHVAESDFDESQTRTLELAKAAAKKMDDEMVDKLWSSWAADQAAGEQLHSWNPAKYGVAVKDAATKMGWVGLRKAATNATPQNVFRVSSPRGAKRPAGDSQGHPPLSKKLTTGDADDADDADDAGGGGGGGPSGGPSGGGKSKKKRKYKTNKKGKYSRKSKKRRNTKRKRRKSSKRKH